MTQKTYSFALGGGLDLVTPASKINPGRCIAGKNYEPHDEGGYRRVQGYEAFDGQPKPSDASYWILNFDAGSGAAIVATNTVTGASSGATGVVMSVTLESGAWGVDAVGFLVLTDVTGNPFTDDENLEVAAAVRAVANGLEIARGSATNALDKTNMLAAQLLRRDLIAAVPGSGPVRGVWMNSGSVYAFRDNAGATAGAMHTATAAGWVEVDLGDYVDFDTGAILDFIEGETITFAPSTATAVVVGLGITSGAFTDGDAAGRLYLKTVTGTITAADTMLGGTSAGTGNCNSVLTATTLPAGGKYEFRNYNFGGTAATCYMWGVNGAGRGFRFCSVQGFAFIHVTGLTDAIDKPEHLHAHKKHLFFSIGASLQHSGVGAPMVWSAVFSGAGELATGDDITSLRDQPGDIMGIFNRNRTYLLYGSSSLDWDLVNFSLERGAIEWTVQDLGYSFYVDDRGVQNLSQTDVYGDLKQASISELIDPLIQVAKLNIVDSIRLKTKNQYRIFFSDKSGLLMRWDNDLTHKGGSRHKYMPFEYNHKVESICAEENADGFEECYFGSDDGFVYQAEIGESFNGEDIEYSMRLAFCHCNSSRHKKRFHKGTFQIDAAETPDLQFSPEFSYGAIDQPVPGVFDFPPGTLNVGGGIWDRDFWEDFIWDGQLVGEAQAYVDGVGINISMLIKGSSNFERPHTLQSATYNFSIRGLRR